MKTRTLLLALLAAAALGAGWFLWTGEKGSADAELQGEAAVAAVNADADAGSPASPANEPPSVRVSVYPVAPTELQERVVATGELRANEAVDLTSEVSGKVAEIFFEEGQAVRRGELLVKIVDDGLQARLQRAQAERDLAQRREQRARVLLEEGTISQEFYEEASTGLMVLDADIGSLEVEIRETEIRAPFDGVIGLRRVSRGTYVTPGLAIARLQSLRPMKLDFSVPEKYAARVTRGIEVSFTVEGLDEGFRGTVYAVEPVIDAATRTLTLRARTPNPGGRLLPGAFARVELVLDTATEAIMVPALSLVPAMDSISVYIVDDEGRAQPRVVQTGVRTEQRVQVVDGLEIGDRVIVSGLERVSPGARVRAAPVAESPISGAPITGEPSS